MKYNVGQITYVVFSKQAMIVPCLVVEENTKKTLDGQKTEYKVVFAPEPDIIVDLHKVDGKDGKVFVTLDEASNYLSKKFATYVEMQRVKATKMASVWEKHQKRTEAPSNVIRTDDVPNDEYVIVTLPDGTNARVKLPNVNQDNTEANDEKIQRIDPIPA